MIVGSHKHFLEVQESAPDLFRASVTLKNGSNMRTGFAQAKENASMYYIISNQLTLPYKYSDLLAPHLSSQQLPKVTKELQTSSENALPKNCNIDLVIINECTTFPIITNLESSEHENL